MNKQNAIQRIVSLIEQYAALTQGQSAAALMPASQTSGKLYEAHVLSKVIEHLHVREHLTVRLVGQAVALKSSPGPINRSYAYFQLFPSGATQPVAEMWTDTEFKTLSWNLRGQPCPPTRGEYHELDILITDAGIPDKTRPRWDQVWLGVECKHCAFSKSLLRGILGVRRELSYLNDSMPTHFKQWPKATVPAHPASCLVMYSSDPAVMNYAAPGQTFGIDFCHEAV